MAASATNIDYLRGVLVAHRIAAGTVRRRQKRLPRQAQPDTLRMEYYREIQAFAEGAHKAVLRGVIPALPALVRASAHPHGDRMDAGEANRLVDAVAKKFWDSIRPNAIYDLADRFGRRTSVFQRQQLGRQLRAAVGVDVFPHEPDLRPRLATFATENVALIKTIPQRYFGQVETIVTRGLTQGVRAEDIAEQIQERFGVEESNAMRIARDQIGKLNGNLNMLRQESLGVTGYFWRGMMDNREREDHVDREGEQYDWNDPPEDGHPGEPILCRCYAEPDFGPLLDAL